MASAARDKVVRVENVTPTVHFRDDGLALGSDADSINLDFQRADMSPALKLGKSILVVIIHVYQFMI